MYVQMGNARAHNTDHGQPCVYYWSIHDGVFEPVPAERPAGKDALLQSLQSPVTRGIPEAFLSVVRDWPNHSDLPPTWVASDDANLAQMLSEAYDIPVGVPEDVEATHHTYAGPPGVGG